MKKINWIFILAVIFFANCQNQEKTKGVDVSVPVRVSDVVKKTIFNTTSINGTVSSIANADLRTELEGKYQLNTNKQTGKPYRLGDKVKAGEILVLVNNPEYELSIRIEAKKLDLENSKQEYEKQQSLFEKGGVTQRELKNAELSYINTLYNYENAVLQMNKLKVIAPFDGVIVDLPYFTPNEKINSGIRVVNIMDYSKLIMQTDFPEKLITTIKAGQNAYVTNYNIKNDTLMAVITQLSPAINEATRTFKGVLNILNPELKMRPGMFVKAEVVIERRDSVIVVNRELVQNKRRGKVVYIVDRNTAVEKMVNTGIETDSEVEIISGIEPGEKIITEGYQMLSNRSKVRIQK